MTPPTYRVDENGCWLWQGVIHVDGYGLVRVERRLRRAHRYFYEQQRGPIPTGLGLDHLCHTLDRSCAGGAECLHRRCVNPAHLEIATPAINGRRGVHTRLTPSDVREIRAATDPYAVLADRFGIGESMVSHIKTGRRWKDPLDDPVVDGRGRRQVAA